MSCDKTVHVHAYHDGEMSAGQRHAFESHFATCAECRELLADLQMVSLRLGDAPLAGMPPDMLARLDGNWQEIRQEIGRKAGDRGVMRIAGWMTAAAAAVLIGTFLTRPDPVREQTGWQATAVMPPAEMRDDAMPDLVLAQWMANDLSPDERR